MERIKERRKIVSKCNAQMERLKERRKIVSKCNAQMTFTKRLFILFQITLKQKRVRHKFSAGSLLEKLFAQTGNIFLIIFYVNRLYCVYVILLQALCYFYRPLLLDLWLTVRTGKVNSLDRPFTGQCLITVQTFLPLRSLVLVILQKKFPKMMKYPNNITEP
jgi:hypothetical protein